MDKQYKNNRIFHFNDVIDIYKVYQRFHFFSYNNPSILLKDSLKIKKSF